MSKRIDIGTFSGNDTFTFDARGFAFSRITLAFHSGVFDGGTVTFKAGITGATENIQVTSKIDPSTQLPMIVNFPGYYTIDILCEEMLFAMTGATSPTIQLSVFPEPRR